MLDDDGGGHGKDDDNGHGGGADHAPLPFKNCKAAARSKRTIRPDFTTSGKPASLVQFLTHCGVTRRNFARVLGLSSDCAGLTCGSVFFITLPNVNKSASMAIVSPASVSGDTDAASWEQGKRGKVFLGKRLQAAPELLNQGAFSGAKRPVAVAIRANLCHDATRPRKRVKITLAIVTAKLHPSGHPVFQRVFC